MSIKELRRKLVRVAKSKLYAGLGVRVVDLDIGPNAGIAIELSSKLIERDDPLISGELTRAGAPDDVVWCSSSAIIQPHAGFGVTLPLAGVSVEVGFSAEVFIGVAILASYRLERSAALEAAKRAVRDLPMTAGMARAMRSGTEVTLSGRGRLISRTGIGAGLTLPAFGVESVGVVAGASVSIGAALSIAIVVERLQHERVRVSLHQVSARSAAFELSAHAGFASSGGTILDDLTAEAISGTPLADRSSALAIAAERQLEQWLSIDLRAVHERARGERQIAAYELDLQDRAAQHAYEKLLLLDTRAADDLVAAEGPAVKFLELAEKTRARRFEIEARFGKISLLREASKRDQRQGTLVIPGSDPVPYERIVLTTDHHDAFTGGRRGDKSWIRQLIVISTATGAREYYYHLTHRITADKKTDAADVKSLLALAQKLGLLAGREELLDDDRLLESFGATDRVVDVFFTHLALEKLAKASDVDLAFFGRNVAGELGRLAGIFRDPALIQGTGWDADLEPHTLIIALAAVAGAEETIVAELSITDRLSGRKVVFAEAGALRNFDPAVRAVLAEAGANPRAVDGVAVDPGRPTELTCHVRFVYFDPRTKSERPLPDGIEVRVRDRDPWSRDDILASGVIRGGDGRVVLVVPADDELEPDLYFEVATAGCAVEAVELPGLWDSRHRDPLIRSSVLAASLGAGIFGTPGAPVTWSITYDCFLCFKGLPVGTVIQAIDSRPLLADVVLAEGIIGAGGDVHFALRHERARPNIQFRYSNSGGWRQVALPIPVQDSARIGRPDAPIVFQILEG